MAVDILLKIDGIKGESVIDGHQDEIDVLSWSWGMTQSGTTHTATGGGGGKVNVSDITFTKLVDIATHELIKACTSGRHIKEATLVVRKAGGAKPINYLTLKMWEVLVSSYNTGGSNDDLDRVQETLTFNFARFEIEYQQQDEKGGKKGSAKAGWDIAKNKAA
ncbi:Hcp family type VI secretion system effector [Roseinatronobacter alkalisoli]|uniref:Type VI secretion system tube protein Hcp n=1 Tax=Roseinatronobacter alkalisoli TaxID=3028235 RepID=A0ABT5TCL1_9RHOB|nr:type VI secretion system tube protein Hcp [Roseinatronobacter sp. HJB301]MDD7972865.1 type VI secretion system tube protein Hcp [Roseinatronobacter sp. HJB301]